MTDYLGPLTLSTTEESTYQLMRWDWSAGGAVSVEVVVTATTSDLLAAAVEALAAQLTVGNSYVHFQPGATYPTIFMVTGASELKAGDLTWPAFWQSYSFTLQLTGRPAGALSTLYNAQHVDSPASLSLATMLGTNPPALDVTVDDDAGTDMHSVWCAIAPTAVSDAKWLILASALTWTTMSSGTGATYWSNSNRYTTSSSYQTAPLDTSQYPAGKYRLLARVAQSAGTGYVKDSQNDEAVAITKTTPHLMVIGDLDLPVADSVFGTASNLTLSAKSDGTNTLTVNAFVLLPLDYGYASYHHSTDTTEIDQFDVGPSGIYVDSVTDFTYVQGGVMAPRILAAHVGTLVSVASPTGNTWPTTWGRTDETDVTADTARIKVATTAGTKYGWFAATNVATPLVSPGAWYELTLTRQVTARSAGSATVDLVWQDVDGNEVRTDNLSSVSATDASPVALELHARAPVHAARARVRVGASPGANLTAYFSAVVLRRCPMRLIVVAEDAAGALTSNAHPVHVTVRYQPRYEVAR